ncbi:MAG TPA: S9 family peptidase [Gemmatimonadaceae bacterium]|nr:S9 family peptidase [Gemmatimonadaceae bacterium]
MARRSLAALALVAAPAAWAQTGALSPEDLTAIRSVVGTATPQWSPDGARIMFASPLGGSDLWTVPSTGGFPVPLNVDMGEIAFLQGHQPTFSPDGKWIAYISNKTGAAEMFVTSLDDGRTVQVTHLGARINSYSWSPDSRSIAVADDRSGGFDIYVVAVPGGAITRMTSDPRYDVFPSWTPDGKHVVYVRLDDRWLDHEILVADLDGTSKPVVKDTDFFDYAAGGTFGYPQISPDGATILFRSQRSGWINYWTVPVAGGAPHLLAPEAANQSGAHWSPDGKSILYLSLWNGTQDLRVVPVGGGTPRVVVKPDGAGYVNNAMWSPDGTRISYTLESPTAPADLYVVPIAGGAPTRLTVSVAPSWRDAMLIQPKKIHYKAVDGVTTAAYLYEPRLESGKKAPGILLIHGGPTSSFNDTYQVQAQYFAQRGYAVLLPNIRGSSGYGKPFEDSNNGCWGRCDLKDVEAGVAYLRTLPYIDPAHMGITGTSYGACMTLDAAAFAPGLFQAGIAASGYGDWLAFTDEQEMRHIKLLRYELGPLPQATALYRSISPIYYIDSIKTPLFLIHGEGKQLPRSDASKIFVDRLEMKYKPFRYKTYPNENYYIQSPANIRVMLGDMLAYFEQYLRD